MIMISIISIIVVVPITALLEWLMRSEPLPKENDKKNNRQKVDKCNKIRFYIGLALALGYCGAGITFIMIICSTTEKALNDAWFITFFIQFA